MFSIIHRRRTRAALAVLAASTTAAALGVTLPAAAEDGSDGPIASFTFEGGSFADHVGDADLTAFGSAEVVTDPERGDVLRLDGSDGGYAAFPTGFFDGRDTMTVSLDAKSELSSGNFFTFAFGQDEQSYFFLRDRGGEVRGAITNESWENESAVTGSVAAGEWHHYDIVFDDERMAVYADGALIGEIDELSASVADLGTDLAGYLGRSFYAGDGYFQGWFDDVEIYDRALSAEEVIENAGTTDLLANVSLANSDVLRGPAVVDAQAHTATFLVERDTDVTALAPTFDTARSVTVSPASGTVVDLSTPVTYTITADDGEETDWTLDAKEVRTPVLPGYYADPNIAVFGDTYYLYATSDGVPGWGGNTFYAWSSKDLVDWTRAEEPFLTLDGEDGNVPWATGNAWAPTIIERDGKYYFYFSGHNPEYDRKTIGVAVADSPEGPFVAEPEAMILNNEEVTSGQAIDPAAFRDPVSGDYYLFWGNGEPMYAQLSDDMTSLVPVTIERQEGLEGYREGSFLNYRDGLYHLTYSIDDTGSENYRVGYATSPSVDGPWTYRGVILEKDLSLGIKGTGHSSIINVPGTDDWYIAYHRFAIPDGDGTHRETTIDRITFGEGGLIESVVPTLTGVERQLIDDPAAGLEAEATTRCVAGTAVIVVSVTNTGPQVIDAEISTPHGTRAIAGLASGSAQSATFSSRQAELPEGIVTIASDSSSIDEAFAAQSCE